MRGAEGFVVGVGCWRERYFVAERASFLWGECNEGNFFFVFRGEG